MFGILGIKQYIQLAIVGALALAGFMAYKYYTDTQLEIKTLTANNAKLEDAIKLSEQAVKSLQNDYERVTIEFERAQGEFNSARTRVDELEKKLSDHNIGFLAQERPGLIENVVNKAAVNLNRCFEILSGAPHTEAELSATKRSEINPECPGVANPNYKE